MAKKVQAQVKLQIAAGKATPAPPVGTALGPHGVNIMDFCKNFNAKTAKDDGLIIPVVVTVYQDGQQPRNRSAAVIAEAFDELRQHRKQQNAGATCAHDAHCQCCVGCNGFREFGIELADGATDSQADREYRWQDA